jgi:hypothetical protein
MDHNIGAQFKGPLQYWGTENIIYHQHTPFEWASSARLTNVCKLKKRIGWGLQYQKTGMRGDDSAQLSISFSSTKLALTRPRENSGKK